MNVHEIVRQPPPQGKSPEQVTTVLESKQRCARIWPTPEFAALRLVTVSRQTAHATGTAAVPWHGPWTLAWPLDPGMAPGPWHGPCTLAWPHVRSGAAGAERVSRLPPSCGIRGLGDANTRGA